MTEVGEVAPGSPPSALQRPLLLQVSRHSWASKEGEAARASLGGSARWGLGSNFSTDQRRATRTRTPASVSPVSPQVQVLLYYLQHPPISFAELKRNTLYFSTDV